MSVFLVNARRVMLARLARRVPNVRAEECRPLPCRVLRTSRHPLPEL
jgi:hypothetical protein